MGGGGEKWGGGGGEGGVGEKGGWVGVGEVKWLFHCGVVLEVFLCPAGFFAAFFFSFSSLSLQRVCIRGLSS